MRWEENFKRTAADIQEVDADFVYNLVKVYILGEGEESKQWLASPGRTVEQLFLSHVTKVAKAIKNAWPQMSIIMWDDMMRGMSQDTLKGEVAIWSLSNKPSDQ